jgi:hypothetical protein
MITNLLDRKIRRQAGQVNKGIMVDILQNDGLLNIYGMTFQIALLDAVGCQNLLTP